MSKPRPIPIDINDATAWTLTWQNNHKTLPKAFLIPIDDLLICMEEMGVKITTDANGVISATPTTANIRAYLAIDNKKDSHLLMVGTHQPDGGDHEDIVQGRVLTPPFKGGALIGSGVYNFTTPCPSECDPLSPLNHKIKAY